MYRKERHVPPRNPQMPICSEYKNKGLCSLEVCTATLHSVIHFLCTTGVCIPYIAYKVNRVSREWYSYVMGCHYIGEVKSSQQHQRQVRKHIYMRSLKPPETRKFGSLLPKKWGLKSNTLQKYLLIMQQELHSYFIPTMHESRHTDQRSFRFERRLGSGIRE